MNPHRHVFSHYPLVQLAIAFAAGICASGYISSRLIFPLLITATIGSPVLLIKHVRAAGLVLLFAMFFAAATLAQLEKRADDSRVIKKSSNNRPAHP